MAVTLLIATFVIFGSLFLAPGNPITFLTQGRTASPEVVAQLEAQYHLNDPFLVQYGKWLLGVLQGDLGRSILLNQEITGILGPLAVNTLFLVGYAAVLIVVVGLVVGVLAGLKPGWVDSVLMTGATVMMSVPAFVAAVVLILVFSVQLGWFPVFGAGEGFLGRLHHTTLPAISLAMMSIAFMARLTRVSVRQELNSEHFQTGISRGLPYGLVVRRHVLRNAAVPVLTTAGVAVATLIAITTVVEQIFQLNGLGSYLLSAVQRQDFPVVQAICLIYVAVFIIFNTLIDLSYSLLDPRIPLGSTEAAK